MVCEDSILGKIDPNACSKLPLTHWDVPFAEKKSNDSVKNPAGHPLVVEEKKPPVGKDIAPKEAKPVPAPTDTIVAEELKKDPDVLGELPRLEAFNQFFTTYFANFDTNNDQSIDIFEIDEAAKHPFNKQAKEMLGFAKESTIDTEIGEMSNDQWGPEVGFTHEDLRKLADKIQDYKELRRNQKAAVPEYYNMVNYVMNNIDEWDVNGNKKLDGAEITSVNDSADDQHKPLAKALQFDHSINMNLFKSKSLADYSISLKNKYLLSILNKPMGIDPFVEFGREWLNDSSELRKFEQEFHDFQKKQSEQKT